MAVANTGARKPCPLAATSMLSAPFGVLNSTILKLVAEQTCDTVARIRPRMKRGIGFIVLLGLVEVVLAGRCLRQWRSYRRSRLRAIAQGAKQTTQSGRIGQRHTCLASDD